MYTPFATQDFDYGFEEFPAVSIKKVETPKPKTHISLIEYMQYIGRSTYIINSKITNAWVRMLNRENNHKRMIKNMMDSKTSENLQNAAIAFKEFESARRSFQAACESSV